MEYKILDATKTHIPSLVELEKLCFSLPWSEEVLRSQLPDDRHVFLIAQDEGGSVLGYVGLMHILDEGYISNVAVSPSARRSGIGKSLLSELIRRAEQLELSFLTLEVRRSNTPARSLYAYCGFEAVGERKNYYDFPTEDAIIMTKFLK